jgi:hypothetical protein
VTVAQWRKHYEDFPRPDVQVGIGRSQPIVGWDPAREQEFGDWEAFKPGKAGRRRVPSRPARGLPALGGTAARRSISP